MKSIAIGEFRAHLSSYLNKVKMGDSALIFGDRKKKEFIITSYPDMNKNLDLFKYDNLVKEKITQRDYYTNLGNNMSNWLSEEHDDLFK